MAELLWQKKRQPVPRYHDDVADVKTSGRDVNTEFESYQLRTQEYHLLEDQTSSKEQEASWANRLIYGKKQEILPALRDEFEQKIKLIYIDPPFMTGRTFHLHNQNTPVAYKDTWHNDLDAYLQWLYETFIDLYELLATDGSIYVHLDWRTTHYAKIILDEIFGFNLNGHGPGFKNEIIWHYQSGGRGQNYFARKHDTILFYTKSARYCFHGERVGERRGTQKRNHMRREIDEEGRIIWTIRAGHKVYRYDEDAMMSLPDVWNDISHLHQRNPERTGYATQKPMALLERIILASSEQEDLILDCFCGSGVTPIVAEQLGRRWIACDQSESAIQITRERLLQQDRKQHFILQCIERSPETTRKTSKEKRSPQKE